MSLGINILECNSQITGGPENQVFDENFVAWNITVFVQQPIDWNLDCIMMNYHSQPYWLLYQQRTV